MSGEQAALARARTDAADRLLEADEPLAGWQRRAGGELPGKVAVPQLLEAVRKARTMGLKLARSIVALDGDETVRAWIEIAPERDDDGGGCSIALGAWSSTANVAEGDREIAARRIAIDRELAELTARLDPSQCPIAVEAAAPDLAELAADLLANRRRPWSEAVHFPELAHHQPLHWRLLDGAVCSAPGSARAWTVTIVPLGHPEPGSAGFELLLVADAPLPETAPAAAFDVPSNADLGAELTPVLRPPLARIIANAETIRSRLAGPLAEEYSNYAGDIAAAGRHLLSLVDDLADLEAVEAHDFATVAERIDLADVARRAGGILGVRARAKAMRLALPSEADATYAHAEFRRVLQILLNLMGNAIAYSQDGSKVTVLMDSDGGRARVTVADQGPGIAADQAAKVFEKFERLGRSGDGGSGLGLYISRRLARAMGGELTVTSTPGEGARFTLELPAAD